MISVELERLTHLLNDMHDQNLCAAEMATDFDLVLLICDLVTVMACQISNNIGLEVDALQSFWVNLPENTLRLALWNLLLNAVQAIERVHNAGHICVKLYQAAEGLIIQVLDDGAGFSPVLIAEGIRFLPSRYPHHAETGLAMSQQFIKNMGGSVALSNRPLHGGCVTIVLPKACMLET